MEMLLFQIAGEAYRVDLVDVDEVLHMPTLQKLPTAPSFIAGILNLRGKLVPIVDIMERLGIVRPKAPLQINVNKPSLTPYPQGARILLTHVQTGGVEQKIGVIMDSMQGFRIYDDESYRSSVLDVEARLPYVSGHNLGEDRLVQRILVRELLHSDELRLLQKQEL